MHLVQSPRHSQWDSHLHTPPRPCQPVSQQVPQQLLSQGLLQQSWVCQQQRLLLALLLTTGRQQLSLHPCQQRWQLASGHQQSQSQSTLPWILRTLEQMEE